VYCTVGGELQAPARSKSADREIKDKERFDIARLAESFQQSGEESPS
jgi:hypothetical protein